jgi:hypothetical protein
MKKILLTSVIFAATQAFAAVPKYEAQPDWLQLPEGRANLGNMHGDIGVSAKGEVYVSVGDNAAGLQVYADSGKWLRNVKDAPSDLHGFVIRQTKEGEFLYGSRLGGQEVIKMTLDGEVKLRIPASDIPDEKKRSGKDGKTFVRLTGVDIDKDGNIYVTDGYSSDYAHKFSASGKYIKSFGGKEAPYSFRTLHKLVIDNRFSPARIIATDRANDRVVHLGLDGDFLGIVAKDLLYPADLDIQGDLALVGELAGRVTLLDKSGKAVLHLGHNTNKGEVKTNRTPKDKWRPGIVTAPHGIAFNAKGDIFVAEWNTTGRVHRFNRVAE